MDILRIYADFNGLARGVKNTQRIAVVLDTFGSLRDLSNAGVVLEEGLPLIAVDASDDEEDLEGHGTAQYDHQARRWVIEFDAQGVRYVPAARVLPATAFLCVHCRNPLPEQDAGRFPALPPNCPACGADLFSPLAPPAPAG